MLLNRYGGAGAAVELNAIRTAGTLLIGTGGAAALLLAARRQRATELTLLHTDRDATERRITELYTKAADQLGSDQAPVRLTAQDILSRNLRVPPVAQRRWWQWRQPHEAAPPWPGIRLNLTGALLIDFTLQNCRLDRADFHGAQFTSNASFSGARVLLGASAHPSGWAMRPAQPDTGEDLDYRYFARIEEVAAEKA